MAAPLTLLLLARIIGTCADAGFMINYRLQHGPPSNTAHDSVQNLSLLTGSPAALTAENYQCSVCHHMYDPKGDGGHMAFEYLPDDFVCPVCGSPKSVFKPHDAHVCTVCQHVYDPAKDGSGMAFEDVSDDWVCPVCGEPKSSYEHQLLAQATAPAPPTDTYQCSVCNHMYDPEEDGNSTAFEDLPDDWICPVCGQPKSVYNSSEAYVCTVCQHVYDPEEDGNGTAFGDLPSDWVCPVCGQPPAKYEYHSLAPATACGGPSPPSPGPSPPSPPSTEAENCQCSVCNHMYDPEEDGPHIAFEDLPAGWVCPVCGQPTSVYNPADAYVCTVCQHVYDPNEDGNHAAFEDLPSDWICPVCGQPKSVYEFHALVPGTVCRSGSGPAPPAPSVNAGIVVAAVAIGLFVPLLMFGLVRLIQTHYVDKGHNVMPTALRVS